MQIKLHFPPGMQTMKMKKEDEARAADATRMPDEMHMISALNLRPVERHERRNWGPAEGNR